jgi:hypothetical protein
VETNWNPFGCLSTSLPSFSQTASISISTFQPYRGFNLRGDLEKQPVETLDNPVMKLLYAGVDLGGSFGIVVRLCISRAGSWMPFSSSLPRQKPALNPLMRTS